MRVAALAGADFSAALAAHRLQAHPLDLAEAWNERSRSHVLAGNGFAHDLVRDVAEAAVPAPIRELLYRGIAEYLLTQEALPARIAQPYAEAGSWHDAATFHLRAAEAARRASRRGDEVEQREAVIACLDRTGDADAAFEARRASIDSLLIVRGVEQAQTVIEGMLAAARTEAQRVAALTARANAALMAADHVAGVACAREALALAEGTSDSWLRFEAARLLAIGLSQQGRTDEAEAVLTPFEAMVESGGSTERRGHYWSDLAYVLNSARRLGRTAALLARAIDCARELGDLAELAMLTTNLARCEAELARADDFCMRALLELERAESLAASDAVGLCDDVSRRAGQREFGGIALKAGLLAARCVLRSGDTAGAAARWEAIAPQLEYLQPADCYPPSAEAIGIEILSMAGDRGRAVTPLAKALVWLRGTALPQLPDAFRGRFLHRNPVNQALHNAERRLALVRK